MLGLPWIAAAEIVVPGDRVTLRWNAASGPVTGYEVRVARNGAAAVAETYVGITEVTLSGTPGERLQISVRAYSTPSGGAPQFGPTSPSSEPIRFAHANGIAQSFAVIDCPSCPRSNLQALPATAPSLAISHPSGGPWDLIRYGRFSDRGSVHVALRQRVTGELFIGDHLGSTLLPRTFRVEPGFERSVVRADDFDADALDELLLWDNATGRLVFWGMVNDYLTPIQNFATVDPSFKLIGISDFNGDGHKDLWFDSGREDVWIMCTYFLQALTLRVIGGWPAGFSAVDVGDYDADGRSDVLLRSVDGSLKMGMMRGTANVPSLAFHDLPRLPGDELLTPRLSANLDGEPGAEILLQTALWGTGAVDMIQPTGQNPAQRQRLFTAGSGSTLVQVVQ